MILVVFLLALFTAESVFVNAVQEAEYEYDSGTDDLEKKGGDRLVGAGRILHQNVKFVVGWNINPWTDAPYSVCTGSLITPKFMISAAHCDTLVGKKEEEACIQATRASGKFRITEYFPHRDSYLVLEKKEVSCTRDEMGGLVLTPIQPKGKAWVGADDVRNNDPSSFFETPIKRSVHHAQSYIPGGSYGTFGGYDITVVEFEQAVPPKVGVQACLPTPSFKDHDVDTKLAGYGRYFRPTCQTDEFSPYKLHYCVSHRKGDSKNGERICHQGPAPQSEFCSTLFKYSYVKKVPSGYEEIGVVLEDGSLEFCYNSYSPNPSSRGWCRVDGDYYSLYPQEAKKDGWGFCSKECYLDKDQPESNVLREVDGHILDENICAGFLDASARNVAVRPEILCIGRKSEWKTKYFRKVRNTFVPLSDLEARKYKHFGQRLDKFGVFNGYVSSAGTCKGDSGGPAYVMENGIPIVVGAVSGGRGEIANCGGINNPVHYVRVSRLVPWIAKVLGSSARDLCWHKDFADRLRRSNGRRW